MLYKLIEYYKKNVTVYALVFQFMKPLYCSINIVAYGFLILPLILLMTIIMRHYVLLEVISFILYFIITAILLFFFNRSAKKIVFSKYHIMSKKSHWRNDEFNQMRSDLFEKYLRENKLHTENKIKTIISLIQKKIDIIKLPPLVAPGIFISLLIPVWIQLISMLYKQIKTLEESLYATLGLLILIIVLIKCFDALKSVIEQIRNDVFGRDTEVLKEIITKLEDQLLKLPEQR